MTKNMQYISTDTQGSGAYIYKRTLKEEKFRVRSLNLDKLKEIRDYVERRYKENKTDAIVPEIRQYTAEKRGDLELEVNYREPYTEGQKIGRYKIITVDSTNAYSTTQAQGTVMCICGNLTIYNRVFKVIERGSDCASCGCYSKDVRIYYPEGLGDTQPEDVPVTQYTDYNTRLPLWITKSNNGYYRASARIRNTQGTYIELHFGNFDTIDVAYHMSAIFSQTRENGGDEAILRLRSDYELELFKDANTYLRYDNERLQDDGSPVFFKSNQATKRYVHYYFNT